MYSGIEMRTRDNPESAMVHQPMRLELTLGGVLRPVPDTEKIAFLKGVADYDAHQKVMAQQYPGAWPWPVSGILKSCTCHPDDAPPVPCAQKYALSECRAKPEAKHFDTEAHRSFMRGLG